VKRLSETSALPRLQAIKDELRSRAAAYEVRAASCATCSTPGACCLDEHFVNVHISRLEAAAISGVIERMPAVTREAVLERIADSSETLQGHEDQRAATYACPLYQKGTGCLVHEEGKPVPCILHACYDRKEDVPPDELQDEAETAVYRLNERVYGSSALKPLPVAIQAILRTRRKNAITTRSSSPLRLPDPTRVCTEKGY